MQERMQYKNHLNETLDFGQAGLFISNNDLHDYCWAVSTKNNKISYFKREVKESTLTVVIFCKTAAEGVAARNRLMEVAEKDVLAHKPGQLIVGDYYYKCYITCSQKSKYLASRCKMEAKLTIMSDAPVWVRETTSSFRKLGSSGYGLDYKFDYTFDYTPIFTKGVLSNENFTTSNFRMRIYGPCSNPVVYVAGHAYGVNCTLTSGEYLTIDSAAKTITKVAVDGTTTNIFNLRSRAEYVFEPIPDGSNLVTWTGDFGIDITLLEERSEPKWI